MKKDITGQIFGRLTVIQEAGKTSSRAVKWLCRCECGTETIVAGTDLRKGHTQSCGCLNRHISRKVNTKHGGTKTRLYNIWRSMRQRCNNPRTSDYHRYGGRGITIAPEWEDYNAFRSWALTAGYKDDLTIERLDNDGAYAPENCTWISLEEQAQNKRNTHRRGNLSLKKYCRVHKLSYWKELQKVHVAR